MILLSRLIKSNWANQKQAEQKVISIKYMNSLEEIDIFSNQEHSKIIEQANEEANAILMQAHQQIEQEKQQLQIEKQNWQEEKMQLIEEAKQHGYNVGLEEGRTIGYQEYGEYIQMAKDVIELSKHDYQSYLDSAERTILNLAIKAAEKIMNSKIEQDKSHFLNVVKKVLQEGRGIKEVQLHVHPVHYQYVLSEKEELLSLFPIQPNLFIFPNTGISENGCVIETNNGKIDATIDTQLKMLKQKLLDLLESEQEE
ncbi:flagellar assembly protein FliH [Niallia nealsonii]|uniref:Flagellar assembly protein FliH n=1 Tax=Niallia nealsonii TaxID=115979 RepID=A0A2N0Z6P2_9BACI|nr:flagellar assembly protein FliH [Niallia nealsonii]